MYGILYTYGTSCAFYAYFDYYRNLHNRRKNRSSAIGYSFRYFATIMVNDMEYSDHIKYLSVDGVYPDVETIRFGEYPITTELYAVTLADNTNENVELFLEWMTSPQGQQIVADTGYVAIQSP